MDGRFSPAAKRFAATRWMSFLISPHAARSCSGEGIRELEPRPQSLAVNHADDKALHAYRIAVPAREFYVLGRRIESRDRIERQRQSRPLADAKKSIIAWWAVAARRPQRKSASAMCEGIGFAVRKVPPSDMAAKSHSQKERAIWRFRWPVHAGIRGLEGSFPQGREFIYREGGSGFPVLRICEEGATEIPRFLLDIHTDSPVRELGKCCKCLLCNRKS